MVITHSQREKLALLGPLGTYSHQAAYERFGDSVEYLPQSTIADVYNALGPDVPLALLPNENSTFGIVIESYDLLRSENVGKSVHLIDEVTLGVQHCLLVKRGTQLDQIQRVLSHEQALGQCSQFISKNLPNATLVKTTSTATAAKLVADSNDSLDAAICSRVCLKMFPVLELLAEGVQNESRNFTSFYVASVSASSTATSRAVLRLRCRNKAVHITSLLGILGSLVTYIDRRPALSGDTPWDDVYFVRLQGMDQDGADWRAVIDTSLCKIQESGGEAVLLGIW